MTKRRDWRSLLDDELIAAPDATGNPEAAIDNLGEALVGRLDGGEHAEAVSARIDGLGLLVRGEKGVEDVAWAGEGAASTHLKAVKATALAWNGDAAQCSRRDE
jgi:hypothetical protein